MFGSGFWVNWFSGVNEVLDIIFKADALVSVMSDYIVVFTK